MGRGEYLELDERVGKPDALPTDDVKVRDHVFYLERATRAMHAGASEAALKYYSRALSQDLQLEEAWVGQCLALLDMGEHDEAALWAARGLEHCPGSGPCFAARASALARMGMVEKAMGFLDTAQRVKKDHWLIWLCRAEALVISGKLPSAEHCVNKSLEVGGVSRWWIMRRAGEMLILHGRHREAVKYLAKAVDLEPREAINHLRLAQAFYAAGKRESALTHVEDALAVRPDLDEAKKLKNDLAKTSVWKRIRSLTGTRD